MVETDIIGKIRQIYPELSKGQKKVAESVIDSWENVAFLSPRELGESIGVSEATVIRFSQVLGYENYTELRQLVQELVKSQLTPAGKMSATVDKMREKQDTFQELLTTEVDLLREGISKVSPEQFKTAVDLLEKANRIFIIGFGVSASLCHFLDFRFTRMQIDSRVLSHGGRYFYEQLMLLRPDDVVVGIGFFRVAEEIIHALDYAKKNDVPTIAVTHSVVSELGKRSDVCLVARRGPVREVNSLVVPMAILNALVISLARRDGIKSLGALRKLDEIQDMLK